MGSEPNWFGSPSTTLSMTVICPVGFPVAAAKASVTRHVRFGTDICLMPFNHPIRLAEDLAVLDNLSDGRVDLGIGMGYAS